MVKSWNFGGVSSCRDDSIPINVKLGMEKYTIAIFCVAQLRGVGK